MNNRRNISTDDIREMRDSIELKITELDPKITLEDCAKVSLTYLSIFYLFTQEEKVNALFQKFLEKNKICRILPEL